MNHRLASALVFGCTVVTATLSAALMTTEALAETPTIETRPFVSTRSRDEVRAELMSARASVSSSGFEWVSQRNGMEPMQSGITRAQARADYIRARNDVHAMTGEDSGSVRLAQAAARTPATYLASSEAR